MDSIIYVSNKAMLLIVILSAIPVIVATVVGLLVGAFANRDPASRTDITFWYQAISCIWFLVYDFRLAGG